MNTYFWLLPNTLLRTFLLNHGNVWCKLNLHCRNRHRISSILFKWYHQKPSLHSYFTYARHIVESISNLVTARRFQLQRGTNIFKYDVSIFSGHQPENNVKIVFISLLYTLYYVYMLYMMYIVHSCIFLRVSEANEASINKYIWIASSTFKQL